MSLLVRRRTILGAAGLALAGSAARAAPKPRVAIRTDHGTIVVELEAEKAPLTSANFLRYVDAHKYDGGSFFRSVKMPGAPSDGTIVGAPSPKDHPFAPIKLEPTTKTGLRHVDGTISLGRFNPSSGTSNFFICLGEQSYLDAHPGEKGDNLGYAAFGHVVKGMAVVRKIHGLRTGGDPRYPDQKGEWLKPPVPILTMTRA